MSLALHQKIEALLFYKTEPMTVKDICQAMDETEESVELSLKELTRVLSGRGVVIMEHEGSYMLRSHPAAGPMIDMIVKKDRQTDLSKPALETLSIILYSQWLSKNDLDYIRGVNTKFVLRSLMTRGLIEKAKNPSDKTKKLYIPTMDTISYMGISSPDDLPEFERIAKEINEVLRTSENEPEDEAVEDE